MTNFFRVDANSDTTNQFGVDVIDVGNDKPAIRATTTSDQEYELENLGEPDPDPTIGWRGWSVGSGADASRNETMTTSFEVEDSPGSNNFVPGQVEEVRITLQTVSGIPFSGNPRGSDYLFIEVDGVRLNLLDPVDRAKVTLEWSKPSGNPMTSDNDFGQIIGETPAPGEPEPQPVDGPAGAITGALISGEPGFSPNLTIIVKGPLQSIGITANNSAEGAGISNYLVDVMPVCFTYDTLIDTPRGKVAAGELQIGDLVICGDGNARPIRWIGVKPKGNGVSPLEKSLQPVRIKAGALGEGLPERDMLVSRQHRVLVRSHIVEQMFDKDEVLVAAVKLVGLPGVELVEDLCEITYVHFLLDQHQVVFAEGMACETLLIADQSWGALGDQSREEVSTLFPELWSEKQKMTPCFEVPERREQNELRERHLNNAHHELRAVSADELRAVGLLWSRAG